MKRFVRLTTLTALGMLIALPAEAQPRPMARPLIARPLMRNRQQLPPLARQRMRAMLAPRMGFRQAMRAGFRAGLRPRMRGGMVARSLARERIAERRGAMRERIRSLTPEQRSTLRAHADSARAQRRALADQVRRGDLTRAQARERFRTWRESHQLPESLRQRLRPPEGES